VVLAPGAAIAQPQMLHVSPGRHAGTIMVDGAPASVEELFTSGPHYTDPSGRRIGGGSRIPSWLEVGSFQNVSVPHLRRGARYSYFVSPDEKVVVVDGSRHVRRVIAQ
jgi:hypothetical protein